MRLPGTQPPVDNSLQPSVSNPAPTQTNASAKPAISIDPVNLIFYLLHKWPIIFLTVVIFTLVAFFYAKSADYIYRAGARVEVFHENRLKDKRAETAYDRLERSASRHIIIMSGEMFHRELVAKLRIKWGDKMTQEELEVPFKIEAVRGSGFVQQPTMIDLFIDSKNPEYALDYLEGILGAYRSYRDRELGQINDNALAGLRNEEERIQLELTKIRSEIAQFELKNKVLVALEREQMNDSVINDLINQLQVIQTERLLKEYQYKKIINSDLTTINETLKINQNPKIREFLLSQLNQEKNQALPQNSQAAGSSLSTDNLEMSISWEEREDVLISLQNKYKQQLKIFQKEHPKMKDLKNEIDTLKSSLDRQLDIALHRFKASYQALKRKEESIETVIEQMQSKKVLSPERESEYLRLKNQEVQMQRKYDLVYERLLSSAGAIDGFSFITIQDPYIFKDPIAPNKLKILAIGPFLGIFFGTTLILMAYFIPIVKPILKEYKAKYKAFYSKQKST